MTNMQTTLSRSINEAYLILILPSAFNVTTFMDVVIAVIGAKEVVWLIGMQNR